MSAAARRPGRPRARGAGPASSHLRARQRRVEHAADRGDADRRADAGPTWMRPPADPPCWTGTSESVSVWFGEMVRPDRCRRRAAAARATSRGPGRSVPRRPDDRAEADEHQHGADHDELPTEAVHDRPPTVDAMPEPMANGTDATPASSAEYCRPDCSARCEDEEQRGEPGEVDRGETDPERERPTAEQPQVDHGLVVPAVAALPEHEQHREHHRGDDEPPLGVALPLLRLHEGQQQRDDRGAEQDDPDRVEVVLLARSAFGVVGR